MTIVAGFDVHRTQITFDALDQETGEVHCGRSPRIRRPFATGSDASRGARSASLFLCETEEQARQAVPPVSSWDAPGVTINGVEFRRVAATG